MRFVLLLLTIVMHTACAAEAATHPTTSATTQSSTVRKADAVDLAKIEKDGAESNMWYQIKPKRNERLCFGQLETYNDDDEVVTTIPIISWVSHDHWTAVEIVDPRLHNAAWTTVVVGPSRGEIWGVLDRNLDDRQKEILLVHSTDSGQTFEMHAILKPSEQADYDSFCMNGDGHGRLSVYLDAAKDKKGKPGFYHYRTTDGGRTWSSPEYEADGTVPADEVPDDAQPSESPSSVQKV